MANFENWEELNIHLFLICEGNYTKLAIKGAVIGIDIIWDCNLDWNFMKHCLPKYSFYILDSSGWNFRHAKYHDENRRTLIKAYGMKFLINVNGKASKFDLTKTIIILITGMLYLTVVCEQGSN